MTRTEQGKQVWYLFGSVVDPETGKAVAYGTTRADPPPKLIESPYVGKSSWEALWPGQDAILHTRTVYAEGRPVCTARLICQLAE